MISPPDRAREGSSPRTSRTCGTSRTPIRSSRGPRRRIAARDADRAARRRRRAALRVRLAARGARRDRRSHEAGEPLRISAPGRPTRRLSRSTRSFRRCRARQAVRHHRRRGQRGRRPRRGVRVQPRLRSLRHARDELAQEGEGAQRLDRPHGGSRRGHAQGGREDPRDHRPPRGVPPVADRQDRRVVARSPRPEATVMGDIFPDLLRKLRDAYFDKHKKTIAKGIGDLVKLVTGQDHRASPSSPASMPRPPSTCSSTSSTTRASPPATSSGPSRACDIAEAICYTSGPMRIVSMSFVLVVAAAAGCSKKSNSGRPAPGAGVERRRQRQCRRDGPDGTSERWSRGRTPCTARRRRSEQPARAGAEAQPRRHAGRSHRCTTRRPQAPSRQRHPEQTDPRTLEEARRWPPRARPVLARDADRSGPTRRVTSSMRAAQFAIPSTKGLEAEAYRRPRTSARAAAGFDQGQRRPLGWSVRRQGCREGRDREVRRSGSHDRVDQRPLQRPGDDARRGSRRQTGPGRCSPRSSRARAALFHFKLVGAKKTVDANNAAFRGLLTSLKIR